MEDFPEISMESSVDGSDMVKIMKNLEIEDSPYVIRIDLENIGEYVTKSVDAEEIAEIIGDIYNSQEKNKSALACFVIDLGIQSMTADNGIFTVDNKLKKNINEILSAIDQKGYLSKVANEAYDSWKNTWEYSETKYKGGTKVLERILLEDFPAKTEIQKRIAMDGKNMLNSVLIYNGHITNDFNATRVITKMLQSINNNPEFDKFEDAEITAIKDLYDMCRKNNVVEKLDKLENLA